MTTVPVTVNLNSLIKFRPTVEGRRIMQEKDIGAIDKDGVASMLLWQAFSAFGEYLYPGSTILPFAYNSITIEE